MEEDPKSPTKPHNLPKANMTSGLFKGRMARRGGYVESGVADCVGRGAVNAWDGDPSTGTICRYPIKNNLRISASQTPGDQK